MGEFELGRWSRAREGVDPAGERAADEAASDVDGVPRQPLVGLVDRLNDFDQRAVAGYRQREVQPPAHAAGSLPGAPVQIADERKRADAVRLAQEDLQWARWRG